MSHDRAGLKSLVVSSIRYGQQRRISECPCSGNCGSVTTHVYPKILVKTHTQKSQTGEGYKEMLVVDGDKTACKNFICQTDPFESYSELYEKG